MRIEGVLEDEEKRDTDFLCDDGFSAVYNDGGAGAGDHDIRSAGRY